MPGSADILTYEKKILIRSEQVDMTRKLRISELFRLMEEASIAHTEELGCTREKTLDRGLLWVITRQQAEIDELPAYDEEITVRSWQGDMMHVFFPRFYEIERAGRVIIRGQALWILIDEADRQMIMPEDYDIEIPGRPGSGDMMLPAIAMPKGYAEASAASEAEPGKARGEIVADGLIIREELVTRFSQVDINGHMNNTRYFDIIDDAMYGYDGVKHGRDAKHGSDDVECGRDAMCGSEAAECGPADSNSAADAVGAVQASWQRTPRMIRANYLSELRAGDRFTLSGFVDDRGVIFYEGADGDRIKFRIAYEYQD